MGVDTNDNTNLDAILTEVGEFGIFHVFTYIMISLPNIISAATFVNHMISATSLEYRCKVPECDIGVNNRDIPYNQTWLRSTIPYPLDKIDKCHRYAPKNDYLVAGEHCSADKFDNTKLMECSEYIHASDETKVQTEFNIHCSETYKLALLEFFESSVGTSTFAGSFILAIELLTTRYRVLGSTIISVSHPIGEIIFGFIAMYIHDFRYLLRITYIPGLFTFVNFLLVPESIRWLLVTGRVDRAVKNLRKIARMNGKELSEKSIEFIKSKYSIELKTKNIVVEKVEKTEAAEHVKSESFFMIFKSRKLLVRFLVCSYQWVACCFYYYGISLHSTQIPGANRYVSFIIVVSVEIPSVLLAMPLINRMKRRTLLFSTLFISAISIAATSIVPEDHSTIVIIFSMIGKACITFAFTLLYVYTAEQWPTNLRTTIMNYCSMIGRTGSMVAPFVVIVGSQYGSLPALLFGASAILAAIGVLFNCETYNKRLPDTIEEAKHL